MNCGIILILKCCYKTKCFSKVKLIIPIRLNMAAILIITCTPSVLVRKRTVGVICEKKKKPATIQEIQQEVG